MTALFSRRDPYTFQFLLSVIIQNVWDPIMHVLELYFSKVGEECPSILKDAKPMLVCTLVFPYLFCPLFTGNHAIECLQS